MENDLTQGLKESVTKYFDVIIKFGLIIIVLTSYFLFANLTTDFFDTPKFVVILAVTVLLFVLINLKFTVSNKVVLTRTPLDLPLVLLVATAAFSTVFSSAQYVSILGNGLKVQSSLVVLVVYALLYFTLVNTVKGKDGKWLMPILNWGGAVLAVITLATYWGLKLPISFVSGVNFTTTGSSFSTSAILALLVPVLTYGILSGNQATKMLNSVLLALFGVTIALVGGPATWIAAAVGFALPVFLNAPRKLSQIKPVETTALAIPLILVVLVAVFSFFPVLGGGSNPLYSKAQNFPREVTLGFTDSWQVSVSAFRDVPFWGTGPGTYIFDFTKYKPLGINTTKFWSIRFDSAFNEYLQILATLGGVGLVALLSFTALFLSSAYSSLVTPVTIGEPSSSVLKKALALSGLVFFIILALHVGSIVLWIIGIVTITMFMVLNESGGESFNTSADSIKQIMLGLTGKSMAKSSSQTIKVEALPSVLLTISVGVLLFVLFFEGKLALADYHHRLALNAASQNQGIVAYNELIAAEKLNPQNDLYRTDLAQVNFALANAIALAKGPTQASPNGSLTDQDKQNIQVLLQQSINEARTAVALSPNSAANWEILALLYRQISGVAQNALVFSLDSYGKAIFADPLNPLLRLSVGGTYYAIKNYDLAIRFFTDAINLKPDFANGYYNLSVAERDKGDLVTAQALAEKVVTLVDKNSADYKIATDYLNDLKAKTGTATQPPAATTSGSLQNEQLPKVVNVGNPPEKIATPPAVPKPTETPTPAQ